MKVRTKKNVCGFTLIEAVMIIAIVASAFFGFGFLFGNLDQEALKADLTVLAVKLAREKMEQVIQTKADSGYAAVVSEAASPVTSGSWSFMRSVATSYVNPADMSNSIVDTGYKKVDVTVSWGGAGAGESITLTTLVANMVPSAVTGIGFPPCP